MTFNTVDPMQADLHYQIPPLQRIDLDDIVIHTAIKDGRLQSGAVEAMFCGSLKPQFFTL